LGGRASFLLMLASYCLPYSSVNEGNIGLKRFFKLGAHKLIEIRYNSI
jgi:hypothetical protein